MVNEAKLSQGIQFLAQQGLNLFAVLDCAALPDKVTDLLRSQAISLDQYARLVLVGNSGGRLWPALQAFGMQTAHPVDYFSLTMTEQFIEQYLDAAPALMVYPTDYSVPLQQLGALAGWHHPSPLGLGINQMYGLWFAYRTAFLTSAPLPLMREAVLPSPCDTCQDQPCITACPAQAVQGLNQFNISRCVRFRRQTNSPCQDRCLSRLACPVAPDCRYPLAQIQYHYAYSLSRMRLDDD